MQYEQILVFKVEYESRREFTHFESAYFTDQDSMFAFCDLLKCNGIKFEIMNGLIMIKYYDL